MVHELSIERRMAASPAALWQALTGHLTEWWCPRPWTSEVKAMDLRPGGAFNVVMKGPDGETSGGDGVILEAVPERRFVFSSAFTEDWVPQADAMFMFVGMFELTPDGDGTLYRATARHWDAETCEKHRAMGFADGWGAVAAQWEETALRLEGK